MKGRTRRGSAKLRALEASKASKQFKILLKDLKILKGIESILYVYKYVKSVTLLLLAAFRLKIKKQMIVRVPAALQSPCWLWSGPPPLRQMLGSKPASSKSLFMRPVSIVFLGIPRISL